MQLTRLLFSAVAAWPPLLTAAAFPWTTSRVSLTDHSASVLNTNASPSDLLRSGANRPALYQQVLAELQALEAEPLCHRVVARLLVNNCQLLEGKDDVTVHTDSGRRVRDFVDAYAASLAICDLERASFTIPQDCDPFRESTMSQLPLHNTAQLHVNEAQIRACLTGLAASPSSWNTWVSYSHKAIRFCEAARADHEKTQNILVFQRLTRAMAKLVDGVEADLQRRMEQWDTAAEQTENSLKQAMFMAESLQRNVKETWSFFETSAKYLHEMTRSADEGVRSAGTLQRALTEVVDAAYRGHSDVAYAYEQAMVQAGQRANSEWGMVASTVQAIMDQTTALQGELTFAQHQMTSLALRQESLEQDMERLSDIGQTLVSSLDNHTLLLAQANNITTAVLGNLEATATATSAMQDAVLGHRALARWWPYVMCPAISLVLGSYGLPPSIVRNFGLLAVGELAGFLVSSFQRPITILAALLPMATDTFRNATTAK